jgi:hypothetical protein
LFLSFFAYLPLSISIVTWGASSNIFLHRSQCRQLVTLINNEPDHVYLPLTIKKVPTPEGIPNEGGELFATAVLDISSIVSPGQSVIPLKASLQGDGMDVTRPSFSIDFASVNRPLVEESPMSSFQQPLSSSGSKRVIDSGLQITTAPSKPAPSRDILQELRDEIANTVERISQEYVALFPQSLAPPSSLPGSPAHSHNSSNQEGNRSPSLNSQAANPVNPYNSELEERKDKFLQFILSNGLFHELQENLRIKIQLLIKEHYGSRGRALGKSEIMKSIEASSDEKSATILLQNILSELYTFIMKQCNLVMNSLFKTTIIQKDLTLTDNPAVINDEYETDEQIFHRLLRQGNYFYSSPLFVFLFSLYLSFLFSQVMTV